MTKLAFTASIVLLMATGLMPRQAAAVTVAECLDQSHNPTAASKCQELIDNGNRTADVYLRLAEALNVIGKRSESYQRIEEGLKANPGNAGLAELKAIVRSNLSEQEYLDAQASKGPSQKTTNKAKLRILRIKCLKKTGPEALDACDEFVALGGTDSEIDQKRESLLASQPAPPKPVDTVKVPAPPEEPKSAKVIDLTPAPTPPEPVGTTDNPQQAKDREAYKRQVALVRKIQTALNDLGYQAGVPDGLTGLKTQSAIKNFYADTKVGPRQPIGQTLLVDLERAQQLRSDALTLHEQGRAALASGDTTTAGDLLNSAQQLASWVTPTDDLAEKIANRQASQQAQKQAEQSEQAQRNAIARVNTALNAGDLDGADQRLEDALQRFPEQPELLTLQNRLTSLRAAQQQEEAAQQAEAEQTRKIDTSIARAEELLQRGSFDAALAELSTTASIAPNLESIQTLRTRIEQGRQQHIQADDERKRQDAATQKARELIASAQVAMDNGELDNAGALLTQARTTDPSIDTRELDKQLQAAIEERSSLALAQRQREAAEQQRQRKIDSLEQLASMALDQGNAESAGAFFDDARAIDPDYTIDIDLQRRLEQQLDKNRIRKEATTLLTRAREELGNDRLDQARQLTRQARTLDPTFDETDLVAAEITRRQRAIDVARETDAKTAVETRQNQQDAAVATLLGNAKNELAANNPTAARAIAEEILALQPGNVEAINIINRRTDQSSADQQRLAELLERGETLLNARKSRNGDEPDYFTDDLPASIDRLFNE